MSWRTVIVSNRAKLEYSMGYLVVRGEDTHKIFMDEISIVIVESTAVALTAVLLNECIKRKIKVIFCDETRNPASELLPYACNYESSRQIRKQIKWTEIAKKAIWAEIVKEKIHRQKDLLEEYGEADAAQLLAEYAEEVEDGDITNREGHAAKVYFNALFGKEFSRRKEFPENVALNYGYAVLLSAFNRMITSCGYLTQLGIFHENVFNPFNLGSDLMEPFRPIIDRKVLHMSFTEFATEQKKDVAGIMSSPVNINGKSMSVENAIDIYTHSFFAAMETEDVSVLKFYTLNA